MIDLTRLKAFIFAAETLSFSDASKLLHLTQPTVSHHIKTLEKNLGVELFERRGNQLILTEAGTMLIPWARKLIRQSNEIRDMMEALQEKAIGNLKITCSAASGKYVLPHLAARFQERFPEVRVSILPCASREVAQKLLEDEVNLAVVSSELQGQALESQSLYIDTIKLVVPANHPWTRLKSITPADLLSERIIMREEASGTYRVLVSELAKNDITVDDLDVFLELGNAEGIVQAVSAGYGISFVSPQLAGDAIALGRIKTVEIEDWALYRRVYLVRKTLHTPQRVTDTFWSFVHDPSNKDLLPNPEVNLLV